MYSVEQRTHEIGIRIALGAKRRQILGLILGRGLRLSVVGAAIGIAGGLALTKYLKSLLYGVTPHDPVTLAAGGTLVILVALGAAYLPARRAVNQDPIADLPNGVSFFDRPVHPSRRCWTQEKAPTYLTKVLGRREPITACYRCFTEGYRRFHNFLKVSE